MIKKIYPYIIICFVWIIFSSPFLFNSKIPFPVDNQLNHFSLWNTYEKYWGPVKNPATTDVINQIYPWKHFTIESLKNKEIPLWNPYSFSGTPHLANYQSAVFSISNIFYFILDFKIAWGIAVVIQPLLAGMFMLLFMQSLKRSKEASIISAVSFMFCGFITAWINWTTLSLAISFLPLALFAIEKYFSTKNLIFLLILLVSIPLSFFSGHFQTSLYFFGFINFYLLFKYAQTKDLKTTSSVLIFIALGLTSSFPQIIPSLELYFNSVRSGIFSKIFPFPITHLPLFFAPDFYGNPVTRNAFFGNYGEWSVFFGTIPFFLAIYSLLKKNSYATFFLISLLIFLLIGLNTPLLDFIISLKIPVISTSSAGRILVLTSFCGAVLAGFGLDLLTEDMKKRNFKNIILLFISGIIIFGTIFIYIFSGIIDEKFSQISLRNIVLPSLLFFILFITSVVGFIKPKFIKIILLILITVTIFDMLRFSTKWQTFQDKNLIFINTPIVDRLLENDNLYRTLGPFVAEGSVYFNLPINFGYDPLYISRYGEFLESLDDGKINSPGRVGVTVPQYAKYFPKTIDFLGIKYILIKKSDLKKPWVFPLENFPTNKFSLIYSDKNFLLYENLTVSKRAFLVGNYTDELENQKIIDEIISPKFNFNQRAILEKKINTELSIDRGEAEILSFRPNKIVVNTKSNSSQLLVMSDNYYPGWEASVNNSKSEILRTNYSFRGVVIPKGESVIEFIYFPNSFKYGLIISFLSIVLASIILLILYRNDLISKKHS